MHLATAQEMNAWDTATIKMGMPAFSLMENASREVWHVIRETLAQAGHTLQGKRILILAGGGNNGGDAIALARLFHTMNTAPYVKVQASLEENFTTLPHPTRVLVVHTKPLSRYQGMAQEHVQLAMACGVRFMDAAIWLEATQYGGAPFFECPDKNPEDCKANPSHHYKNFTPHIIVDGLLGTGFQGPLHGTSLEIIKRLNHWLDCNAQEHEMPESTQSCELFSPLGPSKPQTQRLPFPHIFAIDSPSGIDGKSGLPSPIAIRAHTTVTFEAPKLGLVLEAARPYVGNVVVRPIGIPNIIQQNLPTRCTLLGHEITRFLPQMHKLGHKGDAGHVLVIGGSKGLTGAAHLSAMAALRSGAGLVSMAVPAGLELEAKCGVPDIMTLGVGVDTNADIATPSHLGQAIYIDGKWPKVQVNEALEAPLKLAATCRAIVLGPGIGRSVEAAHVVKAVLSMPKRPPVIIDADALFALAHFSEHDEQREGDNSPNPLLSLVQAHDILTPHPTEAARILGWSTQEVQADRMAALDTLTNMVAGTVILKGACTLIGQVEHDNVSSLPTKPQVTVSPFIEPHLSVAGSGDVLAGVIASLVAQGVAPKLAAPLGVFLHAKAGALLGLKFPKRGNTASDMVKIMPQALVD